MKNYSILLVDDEEIALMGLEQGVNWEALGITTRYHADSAAAAAEILNSRAVDIMISDIEMPGGNGLDLIRWVKSELPDVVCIFCTCHAEFSYCQDALHMGALDYVLKPIPYMELELILRKAIVQIENRGNPQLNLLWEDLRGGREESVVDQVKKRITENITSEITREELAKSVYMSPDYLSKLFKKEAGVSLSDYIIKKRILLAKQLLIFSDLSVEEITERFHFSSASYFIKVFKRRTGITPQQYRAEYKKQKEGET